MIEPTNEMERAYDDAAWENPVELGGLEMANIRAGLAAVLAIVERDQAAEVVELRALFDLQWTRTQAACEMWRAEDPEKRANVRPDLGDLLAWLMERKHEQVPPGPCSSTIPMLLGGAGRSAWCQLRHGHAGDHEGEGARWKEQQP